MLDLILSPRYMLRAGVPIWAVIRLDLHGMVQSWEIFKIRRPILKSTDFVPFFAQVAEFQPKYGIPV